MKIFLLERIERTGQNEMAGYVIVAQDETQARRIASGCCEEECIYRFDENYDRREFHDCYWMHNPSVRVTILGDAAAEIVQGIKLGSFRTYDLV